ncbi:MAG TPA: DUF3142 domain-containing protein [Thermoanaerobaculia bacterium]|nr:DUF3142 domain-containing protein [Thermoanaerobaculia bacterium]
MRALALLAVALGLACTAPPISGPLPHEAYLWQRQWTPAVREAVGESNLAGLVVLAAEVDLSRLPPRVSRAGYDAAALRGTGRPVGLAIRIGSFSRGGGRFRAEPGQIGFLAGLAREVVSEARERGIAPAELQLDYDCPESRLDEYPALVRAVREAVAPVPVVLTALPTWLRHERALRDLLDAADGWVLQVHSFEPPAGPDAPIVLCDPVAARRWVEEAARLGRPFRVALPTYGYVAAFDARGKLLGLSAEGPALSWPAGVRLRTARSDPAAMAGLVREWTRERPRELAGILWYRLPSAGDRLNWARPTFQAVLAGRTPRSGLRAERRAPEPGLVEIELRNDGEADAPWPPSLRIRWSAGELLAADGLAGYRMRRHGPLEIDLERGPSGDPLRPGERRTVAWLRFASPTEVSLEVSPR